MAFPLFHPDADKPPPLALSEEEFQTAFPAENAFVERKSGVSGKRIQEAVAAFSNTRGGVVLIGVEDSGRILGKELTQRVEESLHQAVAEVRNPGRYSIYRLLVEGVPVTILSVERRVEGFAQTSSGRVLVRRGARNAPLFDADLARFISERALRRFELSETDIAPDDISRERLGVLARVFGWADEGTWLERLVEQQLAAPSETTLTVAGALYLVENPDSFIGKAYVEILRFPEGSEAYDKRTLIAGPLNDQVDQATNAIMDELGTELVVLGVERHELPRLPRVVLREAIANAVAHRSYELSRSAVRIEVRTDEVQVVSPGPLPVPVTEANIREAQAARNISVINVLRRFRLAEDAGRGVDVMQDSMRDELLDPPRFRDTGHSVIVTLPIRSAVTARERAWIREVEPRGEIEPGDRVLLVHAARNELLTNRRVRELLGVDRVDATRALQRLRDTGFLTQEGQRGGATYRLDGDLLPPAGLRLPAAELEAVVLQMAREEPVTNAKVRRQLGLDRLEALEILDSLRQQGRLVRRGERRGTHYVLPDR